MTKNHSPVIAELKAGVVQIVHEAGQAPEKYFVSGGFALTHANSVTVSAAGGVLLLRLLLMRGYWRDREKEKAFVPRLFDREYSSNVSLAHTPTHTFRSHPHQQDIAVVEAAKLEDIDLEEIPKIYAEAMKDFNAAPEGSKARVEAQIEVEVAKSLAGALGVVLV